MQSPTFDQVVPTDYQQENVSRRHAYGRQPFGLEDASRETRMKLLIEIPNFNNGSSEFIHIVN